MSRVEKTKVNRHGGQLYSLLFPRFLVELVDEVTIFFAGVFDCFLLLDCLAPDSESFSLWMMKAYHHLRSLRVFSFKPMSVDVLVELFKAVG